LQDRARLRKNRKDEEAGDIEEVVEEEIGRQKVSDFIWPTRLTPPLYSTLRVLSCPSIPLLLLLFGHHRIPLDCIPLLDARKVSDIHTLSLASVRQAGRQGAELSLDQGRSFISISLWGKKEEKREGEISHQRAAGATKTRELSLAHFQTSRLSLYALLSIITIRHSLYIYTNTHIDYISFSFLSSPLPLPLLLELPLYLACVLSLRA
jgi:hypothetical protein